MTTQTMSVFVTLPGNAEEAMNYYQDNFPQAKIEFLTKYGKNIPGTPKGFEDKVLNGQLSVLGQTMMFMDMDPLQAPKLSWMISLYVTCSTEKEFDQLFKAASYQGTVVMGPEPILDFKKVAWVTDKFGITWQLVLV